MPRSKQSPSLWRTLIEPALTAAFGAATVHAVVFQPDCDRGGARDAVVIMIPEAPPPEIAAALKAAATRRARLVFLCDTREQADDVAAHATGQLRHHRRVAYERAAAGEWGQPQ